MSKTPLLRVVSRWSEIYLAAVIGLGPLAIANTCSAQRAEAPVWSPIETSQVFHAMRDRSLPTDGSRIRFPAQVSSSVPSAKLLVESVSLVGDREVRLRLACADHNACLPFFATAFYEDAVDPNAFQPDTVDKVSREITAKPSVTKTSPSVVASQRALDGAKNATLLKAGAPATLELETERIHVRIEVISLQSGAPGNRVRVSSLDHKQTYVAQVVTPTLLKGEISQ